MDDLKVAEEMMSIQATTPEEWLAALGERGYTLTPSGGIEEVGADPMGEVSAPMGDPMGGMPPEGDAPPPDLMPEDAALEPPMPEGNIMDNLHKIRNRAAAKAMRGN